MTENEETDRQRHKERYEYQERQKIRTEQVIIYNEGDHRHGIPGSTLELKGEFVFANRAELAETVRLISEAMSWYFDDQVTRYALSWEEVY